jgi:4,5-DOPA dioxygenase extradiol
MNRRNFIYNTAMIGSVSSLSSLKQMADNLSEDGEKMPVLFVGHGSPMNAIEDNEFTQRWRKLGMEIKQPKAVLCISAHWLTRGTHITAMNKPQTIHDFGGFPKALFDVEYPAPGSLEWANTTKNLIKNTEVGLNHDWGLDHGTWSVVKQMYPKANIPVLQLSIDYYKEPIYHYELGKHLYDLRKKGVLIIGSGNMVHNLGMIKIPTGGFNQAYGYDWTLEINEKFKDLILDKNHTPLINYNTLHKDIQKAIPTPDHYYPLLYIMALQDFKDKVSFFNDKAVAGSLTMTSVMIA